MIRATRVPARVRASHALRNRHTLTDPGFSFFFLISLSARLFIFDLKLRETVDIVDNRTLEIYENNIGIGYKLSKERESSPALARQEVLKRALEAAAFFTIGLFF